MNVLIINGHDYSDHVLSEGYKLTRNALDSDKSGRTKDGVMRRVKITDKRKLEIQLGGTNMTRELVAQLDTDLSGTTCTVTYADWYGTQTREFYTADFTAEMRNTRDGRGSWYASSFTLTEV